MGLLKKFLHNANPLTPVKNLARGDINGTLDPGHHILSDDYGKAKDAKAADKAAKAAAAADFAGRTSQDWINLLPSAVTGGMTGVPQQSIPQQSPISYGPYGDLAIHMAGQAPQGAGLLGSIAPQGQKVPQQQPMNAQGLLTNWQSGLPGQQMPQMQPETGLLGQIPTDVGGFNGMPPTSIPYRMAYRPYGK